MMNIITKLQAAIAEESAAHAPRTTLAIEAMREAMRVLEASNSTKTWQNYTGYENSG